MFCGECGAQNPDTNKFCKNCGKPLVRRQPAEQPPQIPVTYPAAQPAPVPAVCCPTPRRDCSVCTGTSRSTPAFEELAGFCKPVPQHPLVGYPYRHSCYCCDPARDRFPGLVPESNRQDRDLLNYRNYPRIRGNCRDHYAGLNQSFPFFEKGMCPATPGRVAEE